MIWDQRIPPKPIQPVTRPIPRPPFNPRDGKGR